MHWKKQYVLGVGSNGLIYLATPSCAKNYLKAIAVKSAEIDKVESIMLRKEGKILNQLKGSPYIVRCFGEDESVEYSKWTYNLLLECAPSGTLLCFILFNGKILESEAARHAYQLLMGIRHIHNKGFFHGDIKLSNIFIFPSEKLVKIADFGSAKEVTIPAQKVFDVCSVGCVVAKMLTGNPTWGAGEIEKYQREICDRDPYEEFMATDVSKMAKDFVINCLFCNFTGRLLNVDRLINHPFIQNAISTCDNEDYLINISSTVNDNPFGDYWISKHNLFSTTCKEWKVRIRRSLNDQRKE